MSIQNDRWITEMATQHGMIEPFESSQVRSGVISYGVSSYGYDMRVAREFKIFTNVLSSVVDPRNFDPGHSWNSRATGAWCHPTPLPARIYANEGIAQVLFFRGEPPLVSYKDKKGKYQGQKGVTLPKL